MRGYTYLTNLNKIIVMQKRLIQNSHMFCYGKPSLVSIYVLSVSVINVYMVGAFVCNYCNDNLPDICNGFC